MEKHILERIANLKAISGTNAKKELLTEYLQNELFLKTIEYTLDSRKHYNISLEKFPPFIKNDKSYTINDAFNYLEYLSNKRGCTDFEKDKLYDIACSNEDIYNVVSVILSKTLDCGVASKTINSVRPDTVEIFPYMRCSTVSKVVNISYPAYVQDKLNGEYVCVLKEDGKILHRTRNGNYLNLKGRFVKQFIDCEYDHCAFNGEIVAIDDDGNYLSREVSNGIMLKAQEGTLTDYEADHIVIILWDIVSLDDHNEITPKSQRERYYDRFAKLRKWLVHDDIQQETKVIIVPYKEVSSLSEANEYYKYVINLGVEGVVLKDFNNIFTNTSSGVKDWVKLKPIKTCELRITKWNYGDPTKKYRYCFGSITAESEDGYIVVDIANKFSDKMRGYLGKDTNGNLIIGMDDKQIEFWNNAIGKIIEVDFCETCENEKSPDKMSLYLAICQRFRHDKDLADTSEYIKSL